MAYQKDQWYCLSDSKGTLDAPMKMVGDTVSCLSTNGRDCMWNKRGAWYCEDGHKAHWNDPYPPADKINPVVCGPEEYKSPEHWCSRAKTIMSAPTMFRKNQWYCVSDSKGPLDFPMEIIDDNNVACLSTNARDCVDTKDGKWCDKQGNKTDRSYPPSDKVRPVVCGPDDYKDPNHWCTRAKNVMIPAPTIAPSTAAAPATVPTTAPAAAPAPSPTPTPAPEPAPAPAPEGFWSMLFSTLFSTTSIIIYMIIILAVVTYVIIKSRR